VISVISIFFTESLKAQNLSLTEVKDFRGHLRPIFSTMTSQNELPSPMSFFNQSRKLIFAVNPVNLYYLSKEGDFGNYVPAVWGGFVASSNLSLFMQMAQGNWQGENISAFGPVINFIWGKAVKEKVINVSINHLRGPEDFRMKDISIAFLKKWEHDWFSVFYGINAHYINANIHVKESNFKKTINENLYHLRAGISKKIKFIDMGIELDVTTESVITKYQLILII
jgi:hypothetical protein